MHDKILQNATLMYQFGEQDLVYNVNVCILQNISERIPWILKDTLSRQNKGALHEPRRKVTKNFNRRRR